MREKIYNIIDVDGNEDILSVLYDRVMIFCILGSVIPLCFKSSSVVFMWIEKNYSPAFYCRLHFALDNCGF